MSFNHCKSQLIVIINYIAQKTDYKAPFSLLFWRAFCDLGLAIRFVAIPGFNLLLCNSVSCSRGTSGQIFEEILSNHKPVLIMTYSSR